MATIRQSSNMALTLSFTPARDSDNSGPPEARLVFNNDCSVSLVLQAPDRKIEIPADVAQVLANLITER